MLDEEGDETLKATGTNGSPARQRSTSIDDAGKNDGPPVLTPDPSKKLPPIEEATDQAATRKQIVDEESDHEDGGGDEGSKLDAKKGKSDHEDGEERSDHEDGSGDEGSELDDKEGKSDHKDGDGGLDHEDGGGESDHEDGNKKLRLDGKKEGPDHEDGSGNGNIGGSPLGGTGAEAGQLLGWFTTHLALPNGLHLPQIGYPNLAQITAKVPDPVKNLFPEKIEFSPEMNFAGGAITGTAIKPTLHYVNDRFTGTNKDSSWFDYYSWKGFSISNTLDNFVYFVGKSYIAFHGIELFKSHGIELLKSYISENKANALTETISYCKAAFPMTFAAGLIVTTAPEVLELGYNVIGSGCNTIASLAGLSSSDNDADL